MDASRQFTLGTNWRSQPSLVEGVNTLFTQSEAGFLFKDSIPFQAVASVEQQSGLQVVGQAHNSLAFHHLTSNDGLPIGWGEAQSALAQQCALSIAQFIHQGASGEAQIKQRPVRPGDCCVLVRDRNEADTIKQALAALGVDSMFLARKSVFASQTAVDLFAIIQALANPSNDRYLRGAIASELFCYDATTLDALFSDEWQWQKLVEQFAYWHQLWQRQGLMMALNILMRHFKIAERLVGQYHDGQRRLTDLRHLVELLQVQSQLMSGESQILHWFQAHLAEPDNDNEGQQIRLETEQNLVQIITQHTSKGLEYPLVFIPFASRCREMKEAIYHNEKDGLVIDFLGADENLALADHERLAEDIRLLYVALTRAVHYCFIGLWNNSHPQRKKESQLMQTALGRVLFNQGTQVSDAVITQRLDDLSQTIDVDYLGFTAQDAERKATEFKQFLLSQDSKESLQTNSNAMLRAAVLPKPVTRRWRLTSYSAISSQQHHEFVAPGQDEGADKLDVISAYASANTQSKTEPEAGEYIAPQMAAEATQDNPSVEVHNDSEQMLLDDETALPQANEPNRVLDDIHGISDIDEVGAEQEVLDQFTFVKGAQAGSFLHGVLESIDFTNPINLMDVIIEKGTWYGIEQKWFAVVDKWLRDVLQSKLTAESSNIQQNGEHLSLSALAKNQVLVEMEFYLPLLEVKAQTFNHILNQHIPQRQHHYQFEQLNGMLKGFIDLTLQYQGKFYVLDYKSNYLGAEFADYHGEAMANAMEEHDYYLQAILYTLALHRWLKSKKSDYAYADDIGGAYYTFLRGMHSEKSGNGVFYLMPAQALIEDLDALFNGEYQVNSEPQLASSTAAKNSKDSGDDAPAAQGQLDLW